MAFGLSSIEKAKITLFFNHVFKGEIVDDLLMLEPLINQSGDNSVMLSRMGLEPLCVCHEGIIAKKFGENL